MVSNENINIHFNRSFLLRAIWIFWKLCQNIHCRYKNSTSCKSWNLNSWNQTKQCLIQLFRKKTSIYKALRLHLSFGEARTYSRTYRRCISGPNINSPPTRKSRFVLGYTFVRIRKAHGNSTVLLVKWLYWVFF